MPVSSYARAYRICPPVVSANRSSRPLLPPPGGGGLFKARRQWRADGEGVGRKEKKRKEESVLVFIAFVSPSCLIPVVACGISSYHLARASRPPSRPYVSSSRCLFASSRLAPGGVLSCRLAWRFVRHLSSHSFISPRSFSSVRLVLSRLVMRRLVSFSSLRRISSPITSRYRFRSSPHHSSALAVSYRAHCHLLCPV